MWFIIFTKEGEYNDLKIIRKEQRWLKSYCLSGNVRKILTPRLVEKIWNESLCSGYVRLSELPRNYIKTLKRDYSLVWWYIL